MIIATSGHVDHGKTLLVHSITGIETDSLEEEKARGLTIDLGFAYKTFEDIRIGFIDVPGHIRFIGNMLAGVSTIDFGLLVIAADDGPMPQTMEHLAILDLIGIQQGAVVITKIDRVAPERLALVQREIEVLTRGTFLENASVFPVSSTQQTGLEALVSFLVKTARGLQRIQRRGHFRLAIDRSFSVKGAGQVVTGSVISGAVHLNDDLLLAPQGVSIRVRSIHRQNESADEGQAGDRCAMNIAGAELARAQLHRGNYLTSNPYHQATDRCDVLVTVLSSEAMALKQSTPVHIHCGANHVTGRLVALESEGLTPGATGLAQLVLAEPINLWFGDKLIIRDQSASRTLAGGRVLDPGALGRGRSSTRRLTELRLLGQDKSLSEVLSSWLRVRQEGSSRAQLSRLFNVTDAEIDKILTKNSFAETKFGIIDPEILQQHQKRTLAAIERWHAANPQQPGLSLQQISSLARINSDLLNLCLEMLTKEKRLSLAGNLYRLPSHAAQLSPALASLWARIEPLLAADITKPPVLHELAKQLNMQPIAATKLLNQLVGAGILVRPVANRYFLPAGLEQLRQRLIETAQGCHEQGFGVADFRDSSGIGRNLCIEILEYFDRIGVTQRIGDRRKLRNHGT
jgi:selenocysteine-specific elongation factor